MRNNYEEYEKEVRGIIQREPMHFFLSFSNVTSPVLHLLYVSTLLQTPDNQWSFSVCIFLPFL